MWSPPAATAVAPLSTLIAGATVMVNVALALSWVPRTCLPCTLTVNVEVTAVVPGVPEMTPVAPESVSPTGSPPEVATTLQA